VDMSQARAFGRARPFGRPDASTFVFLRCNRFGVSIVQLKWAFATSYLVISNLVYGWFFNFFLN
jgi:hypothetical protein